MEASVIKERSRRSKNYKKRLRQNLAQKAKDGYLPAKGRVQERLQSGGGSSAPGACNGNALMRSPFHGIIPFAI